MALLARKKSLLSETLPQFKELVMASHPHKGVLLASLCWAVCVWVTGNQASSRPGHLLVEQLWQWEGNPPASSLWVLIMSALTAGEEPVLCCTSGFSSLHLFSPWEESRVFIWTPLQRRGNNLHTCQERESYTTAPAQKRLGAGPNISYVGD